MKYSNYEEIENGYKLQGHSWLLKFIMRRYEKKIVKRFIKLHKITNSSNISVSSVLNFYINVE